MIAETCSYCRKRPAKLATPGGSPICDQCAEPRPEGFQGAVNPADGAARFPNA